MPFVEHPQDLLRPPALLYGWLAAISCLALALVLAALGQGIGAMTGGCTWIGVSIPPHHQVWALVNQPSIAFAHQLSSLGYWWGSVVLPLLVAVCASTIIPRSQSVAAELFWLQLSWACVVVAGCWLPLLDAKDGHISRWLYLNQHPSELVWLIPLVGSAIAVIPSLRLLALARAGRAHMGRAERLVVALLFLGGPTALWVVVASLIGGAFSLFATAATCLPLLTTLMLAWYRYPRPYVQRLQRVTAGNFLRQMIVALVLVAGIAIVGRPLGGGAVAGLLWGQASSFNNIRSWIDPLTTSPGLAVPLSDQSS